MNTNKKYDEMHNSENIDAITDRIVMDNDFLAELLDDKILIEDMLVNNGFCLTGKFKAIFYEFARNIRKTKKQLFYGGSVL